MRSTEQRLPRLCFVGPMLGRNSGWVTTQGEILTELFANAGYPVLSTSKIPNRWLRLIDTIYSLVTWQKMIDIVILNVFSGAAFYMADISSLIAKLIGKPLVLWLHGGNLPDFSSKHPHAVQKVLKRADIIVTPSAYLEYFARSAGYQVKIIPNVLNLDQYPFRLRKQINPKFLWMRTFHPIYHPEMAIEVVDELRKVEPNIQLSMSGQDKGLLSSVINLVNEKGLQDSVRFAGFLDLEGKKQEFSTHDIYLHTNRVDNSPVSVLEAAAFGLPVIATRVGGIPYLLENEKTALLVDESDVNGMVQAILRLLNEPELSECLSRNGRVLAEASDWNNVRTAWESIIFELVPNSIKIKEATINS